MGRRSVIKLSDGENEVAVSASDALEQIDIADCIEYYGANSLIDEIGTKEVVGESKVEDLLSEIKISDVVKYYGETELVKEMGITSVLDEIKIDEAINHYEVHNLIDAIGEDEIISCCDLTNVIIYLNSQSKEVLIAALNDKFEYLELMKLFVELIKNKEKSKFLK